MRELEKADARAKAKLRYERLRKLSKLLALDVWSEPPMIPEDAEMMDTVQVCSTHAQITESTPHIPPSGLKTALWTPK